MIVDLFAGAGGWAAALEALGVPPAETVGIELDEDAAETHLAAGFPTWNDDVADPNTLGDVEADLSPVDGLLASPPCQAFSLAGTGRGRDAIGQLLEHIGRCRSGWVEPDGELVADDVRADLTLQPLRWADRLRPSWVVCEQVPPTLPAWEATASVLEAWGYSTWTGVLSAERYGTPQTRRRAFLIARRDGVAAPPDPTHTAYDPTLPDLGRTSTPSLFGDELLPWVSMADAIGWNGDGPAASAMLTAGLGNTAGQRARTPDEPAATILGKGSASWVLDQGETPSDVELVANNRQPNATVRRADTPAPTITGGHDTANRVWRRPGDVEGTRVTVEESALLQGFPASWPWHGSTTARYQQIGNAVPPPLAAAVLRPLVARLVAEEVAA